METTESKECAACDQPSVISETGIPLASYPGISSKEKVPLCSYHWKCGGGITDQAIWDKRNRRAASPAQEAWVPLPKEARVYPKGTKVRYLASSRPVSGELVLTMAEEGHWDGKRFNPEVRQVESGHCPIGRPDEIQADAAPMPSGSAGKEARHCVRCTVEEDGHYVALDPNGHCGHCVADLMNEARVNKPDPYAAHRGKVPHETRQRDSMDNRDMLEGRRAKLLAALSAEKPRPRPRSRFDGRPGIDEWPAGDERNEP